MSIDTLTETPVQDEAVKADILSDLQAKRAKIGAGSQPLDLDVPGYDGQLVLRFTWVPFKQLARTGAQLAKIKEPTTQTIAAAADAIAATCSEILVRVDAKVEPLSTNDVPVTFSEGERLAFALGFDKAPDARTTVIRTFNNEYALIDVANRVTTWLEDTSKAVDEEYVGIAGSQEVRFIAQASVHGVGRARDLLREDDPDVLLALQAANQAAADYLDELMQRLAAYIIRDLSKSMK